MIVVSRTQHWDVGIFGKGNNASTSEAACQAGLVGCLDALEGPLVGLLLVDFAQNLVESGTRTNDLSFT